MSVFVTTGIPQKTKVQKKISRLAQRVNTARREAQKPGPVVVTYKKGE